MDYYNNRRYQWHLAKLSPNEYYHFVTTGEYPLDIPNKPESPVITKSPSQLGSKNQNEQQINFIKDTTYWSGERNQGTVRWAPRPGSP